MIKLIVIYLLSLSHARRYLVIWLFRASIIVDFCKLKTIVLKHSSAKDLYTLIDVFHRDVYKFRSPTLRLRAFSLYSELLKLGKFPLILDLGANIGSYSIRCASDYPNAKVVAVEPEKQNYDILSKNLKSPNIRKVNAAVGYGSKELTLSVNSREGYAHSVEETQLNFEEHRQKILGITINDLVDAEAQNIPFILKIDIEGSEGNLFEKDIEIISKFPIIIVELHDWMFRDIVSTPIMKFICDVGARVVLSHDLLVIVQDGLLASKTSNNA